MDISIIFVFMINLLAKIRLIGGGKERQREMFLIRGENMRWRNDDGVTRGSNELKSGIEIGVLAQDPRLS